MIYTWHNIKIFSKEKDNVCIFFFIVQLLLLKFTKKVVYLDEYSCNDNNLAVLRFDDGYRNVLKYAAPILKFLKLKSELFICPSFVGKEGFLTLEDLTKIQSYGCRLQYHTVNHLHLTEIQDEDELEYEIKPQLSSVNKYNYKFIAYPFWKYNSKVIEIVKKYYEGGLSGNGYADNSQFAMDSIKVLNSLIINSKRAKTRTAVERVILLSDYLSINIAA